MSDHEPEGAGDAAPVPLPFRRWADYPVRGVGFPDTALFTTMPGLFKVAVDEMLAALPQHLDIVAGLDIGGLGFAGALAGRRGLGLVDIRKVRALEADIIGRLILNYDLGDGVGISKGTALAGKRVAIIDDCLISGGTLIAAADLLRRLGARCDSVVVVFELDGLGGRAALAAAGLTVTSLRVVPRTDP